MADKDTGIKKYVKQLKKEITHRPTAAERKEAKHKKFYKGRKKEIAASSKMTDQERMMKRHRAETLRLKKKLRAKKDKTKKALRIARDKQHKGAGSYDYDVIEKLKKDDLNASMHLANLRTGLYADWPDKTAVRHRKRQKKEMLSEKHKQVTQQEPRERKKPSTPSKKTTTGRFGKPQKRRGGGAVKGKQKGMGVALRGGGAVTRG